MSKPKLLDEVRNVARLMHLSLKTEKAYASYIRRYILFHQKRHPLEMGAPEIRDFLSHLAVRQHVAASTQNTAFCALLLTVPGRLKRELPKIEGVERRATSDTLASRIHAHGSESRLSNLIGTPYLVAGLLYGSGLRLIESLRFHVEDLEFTEAVCLLRLLPSFGL